MVDLLCLRLLVAALLKDLDEGMAAARGERIDAMTHVCTVLLHENVMSGGTVIFLPS